jgi:hypothetical protein
MTSPSSSSSSSPDPDIIPTKQKKIRSDTSNGGGKNEGVDPHWVYEPPDGATLVNHDVAIGESDWDTMNQDENLELWLIRVPEGVSTPFLSNFMPNLRKCR